MTELRRDTTRLLRPVIDEGERLVVTERGEPCAEIIPLPALDLAEALRDLRAIGPVELPPRK